MHIREKSLLIIDWWWTNKTKPVQFFKLLEICLGCAFRIAVISRRCWRIWRLLELPSFYKPTVMRHQRHTRRSRGDVVFRSLKLSSFVHYFSSLFQSSHLYQLFIQAFNFWHHICNLFCIYINILLRFASFPSLVPMPVTILAFPPTFVGSGKIKPVSFQEFVPGVLSDDAPRAGRVCQDHPAGKANRSPTGRWSWYRSISVTL